MEREAKGEREDGRERKRGREKGDLASEVGEVPGFSAEKKQRPSTRRSSTVSSKLNLALAINVRNLCGAVTPKLAPGVEGGGNPRTPPSG